MSLTRPLYLTAAALVVASLVFRLAPLGRPAFGAPVVASARRVARSQPLPARIDTDEFGSTGPNDTIIAANIFSRLRIAPARAGAVTITRRPAPSPPRAATYTLYGTTVGPEGAVALIDASALPRGARMHHLGDTIAGARLVSITDSTVTLVRQSGPLVLRLLPTRRLAP